VPTTHGIAVRGGPPRTDDFHGDLRLPSALHHYDVANLLDDGQLTELTSAMPDSPATDKRAVIAAAVTVLLWASAFVSIRSAGQHYQPGALALGRMLTASIVLVAIWAIRGGGLPRPAAWPGIAISGVFWFGLYMFVLNWGEQEVDAGTASMVVNVGPILIALLSGWLLKEGVRARVLAGMAVSFAGAVIVGLSTSDSTHASLLGVGLCAAAAVCYAAGVVSQKPALAHTSALQATTFGCVIGALGCLPFSGQLIAQLPHAPLHATVNLVYLGVFPTALAFTTWAYALSRTTASQLGATTYAVPALVVLMSWLVLDEVPATLTFAGGLLCLAGVAVSRGLGMPRRPRPAAPVTIAATVDR
jgi:drug/metabolite transporter (DMT)-like permease